MAISVKRWSALLKTPLFLNDQVIECEPLSDAVMRYLTSIFMQSIFSDGQQNVGHTNETFEVQDIKLQERPQVTSKEPIQAVGGGHWTLCQTADLVPRATRLLSLPNATQGDLKGHSTFMSHSFPVTFSPEVLTQWTKAPLHFIMSHSLSYIRVFSSLSKKHTHHLAVC